jgi:uncharacterized protein (DUF1810 family)
MTLFHAAAPAEAVFAAVLARWYDGEGDPRTLARLTAVAPPQTRTSNS